VRARAGRGGECEPRGAALRHFSSAQRLDELRSYAERLRSKNHTYHRGTRHRGITQRKFRGKSQSNLLWLASLWLASLCSVSLWLGISDPMHQLFPAASFRRRGPAVPDCERRSSCHKAAAMPDSYPSRRPSAHDAVRTVGPFWPSGHPPHDALGLKGADRAGLVVPGSTIKFL